MGSNVLPAALADFITLLSTEQNTLHEFVRLLETEQQVLIENQPEQLLALAEKKVQAVSELNKLAESRNNSLDTFGARVGTSSDLETWLRENAKDSLPIWRKIRQLAAQARQLNHTNGELIRVKLRHNQLALTALHNAANSVGALYGPDGQPRLTASGRILGTV